MSSTVIKDEKGKENKKKKKEKTEPKGGKDQKKAFEVIEPFQPVKKPSKPKPDSNQSKKDSVPNAAKGKKEAPKTQSNANAKDKPQPAKQQPAKGSQPKDAAPKPKGNAGGATKSNDSQKSAKPKQANSNANSVSSAGDKGKKKGKSQGGNAGLNIDLKNVEPTKDNATKRLKYLRMKLHTIESMEKKVKSSELELDPNQKAKVQKKKEIQNTIKAVEYSLKQGSKGAGR
ncbi:translation initiation factor IF-2 isoform X2 [Planococcus citri]|uniref:translation initiation factor IF-2 isoform X2 n=1 Tax=Planococcus citri TaxID=170843 RepID=UPI0031FA155F